MQFGVGWWFCEYVETHPIVPNCRVSNDPRRMPIAMSVGSFHGHLLHPFAGSYHLDNRLNFGRNLIWFLGMLVVKNSPFNKTDTMRSFHTGANWSTSSFGPFGLWFLPLPVDRNDGRLRWKSLSGLAGEAASNTTLYNGVFFSKKKSMGIDSFNSDCFRETTCRLIYRIHIEFV